MIIEGKISVKYALENHKRQVFNVYVKKGKYVKDFSYIKYLALSNQINFEVKDESFFSDYPKCGGIIAEVSTRKYDDLSSLKDLVMIVDGVEDPYNLGYIFRNGAAYNADFIITNKDLSTLEANILKSSAGAYDLCNIYKSNDLSTDLKILKSYGYEIVALMRDDEAIKFDEYNFKGRMAIILGGEKRGINKEILKLSDKHLYFDYPSAFKNALNAVSASAIALAIINLKRNLL